MNALVSCIVPVFNGERFLGEALESILAQSYPHTEVLVVDDGSTDATPQVAASYGARVGYVRQENRGPGAARNRGLDATRGDFVAFLDSDDLWHPDKLECQMARVAELDLCFTQFRNIWAPELADDERRYRDHPLARPSSSYCISTLLARRAVFDTIGRFLEDRRFGEITPLFVKAAELGARIEVVSEVLACRRFHAGSFTATHGPETVDSLLWQLKEFRDAKRRNAGE